MLWHLGAKMAHKSARTTQDNHQIILEVKVMILLCVFEGDITVDGKITASELADSVTALPNQPRALTNSMRTPTV